MAPPRGAERLLAAWAPIASARFLLALAAVAALTLAGCGGDSDSETTSGTSTAAQGEEAKITLTGPGLKANGERAPLLPASYTCDGKNSWPTLRWKDVPDETEELVLLVLNLVPVKGKLFFDWSVAGLDPSLEGIEAGKLPEGAVVGENGFNETDYSLCPKGAGEAYVFSLYASPEKLSPRQGFDPAALRKQMFDLDAESGTLVTEYRSGG